MSADREGIEERNRILREVDVPGFHALLLSNGKILRFRNAEKRPRDEVARAAIQKARIYWRDATEAMIAESRAWLEQKGFEAPERGRSWRKSRDASMSRARRRFGRRRRSEKELADRPRPAAS
jgi:hypothetical protein